MASGPVTVTVVISPRERFSVAERSLDSVLGSTPTPHRLVYVDSGSPARWHTAVRARAAHDGFELLQPGDALTPNACRNLAAADVTSDYIAFIDNDVVVEQGWLGALVRCAEETRADIVAPLTLIRTDAGESIHLAGGVLEIHEQEGGRQLRESHRLSGESPDRVRHALRRAPCDFAEFHVMLVRRSALDRVGGLDEALLTTPEHVDLALAVRQTGGSIWFEPTSVVCYDASGPIPLDEADYFRWRWSAERTRRSLDHFADKWGFDRASQFFRGNEFFVRRRSEHLALPDPERARKTAPFDALRHGYAQTPAQLYNQLRDAGFDDAELARTARAMDCAIDLFRELTRPCGRPFLCHCVGTASILAAHGGPIALVLLGLLHAAYDHGGLADAPDDVRRDTLRRRVGRSVEELVAAYHAVAWRLGPPGPEVALDDLDVRLATVCVARIANDLDERLDLAMAYGAKPVSMPGAWEPFFERLADRLGVPELWAQLAAADAQVRASSIPAPLVRKHRNSYQASGTSRPARRRPEESARAAWRRIGRGLRRRIRRVMERVRRLRA